ncbi:MAG: transcriptional regulator [Gemmatimonadota bacterium]
MAKSNAVPRNASSLPKASPPRLTGVKGNDQSVYPVELDRLIHERIRLAIVSALAVNPSLAFNDLKRLLGTSDGNLSVHARKLEDAGYLTCSKQFEGRVPKTEYALTSRGRQALGRYLDHMEALIQATRGKSKAR